MIIAMTAGLIGGLGLFIYGMHLMSEGLKILAGNRMKTLLEVLTNNRLKAILVGTILTMIVQSSSTTTVMVVGFVNASLMTLQQAAGVILGANIGTTITAQLIAFNITAASPIFIGIGTVMTLFSKRKKTTDLGSIILGFGLLFFGISVMSGVMEPLKESEFIKQLLVQYGMNPFWGLMLGTLVTGIMQSSSATVGLLQAVALSGLFVGMSSTDAIRICTPIIVGTNIGTCITAMLSCIGTSKTAQKAAWIHLFVNIFGAIWVLGIFGIINMVFPVNPVYEFVAKISGNMIDANHQVVPNLARQIAMMHTFFNVANMVVILPVLNALVKFLDKLIPSEKAEFAIQLDTRLLSNPSVALGQVYNEMITLESMCLKNFRRTMEDIKNKDTKNVPKIIETEEMIDNFEKQIIDYTVQLSNIDMSVQDNQLVAFILKSVHDLERIGDHCVNVSDAATSVYEDNIIFSETGQMELMELLGTVEDILVDLNDALKSKSLKICHRILDRENIIDDLTDLYVDRHIKRLNEGTCNPHAGIVYADILSNLERIGDHAVNIINGLIDALDEEKTLLEEEVNY